MFVPLRSGNGSQRCLCDPYSIGRAHDRCNLFCGDDDDICDSAPQGFVERLLTRAPHPYTGACSGIDLMGSVCARVRRH